MLERELKPEWWGKWSKWGHFSSLGINPWIPELSLQQEQCGVPGRAKHWKYRVFSFCELCPMNISEKHLNRKWKYSETWWATESSGNFHISKLWCNLALARHVQLYNQTVPKSQCGEFCKKKGNFWFSCKHLINYLTKKLLEFFFPWSFNIYLLFMRLPEAVFFLQTSLFVAICFHMNGYPCGRMCSGTFSL